MISVMVMMNKIPFISLTPRWSFGFLSTTQSVTRSVDGYPHRQCFLIIIFTIPIILIIIQEYVMFPNITGRALVQERHVEERSNVYKKLEGVNHDAGFHGWGLGKTIIIGNED